MTKRLHSISAVCLAATALWAVPTPALATGGTTSGAGSGCTVTVLTTNEDGSTDSSVRAFQAPCRSGQSNGDIEYYNPYTDTYETRHDLRIEPLANPRTSSSGSHSGTGTSRGGSSGSSGGSSTSRSQSGGTGASCTANGTGSKAVRNTRSTASGRPCTSTPR